MDVGVVLAPFWLHFELILSSIFAHFGALGAPCGLSWERLGSSWEPEGSRRRSCERRAGSLDPPWVPKSETKMASKINENSLQNLHDFFAAFRDAKKRRLGGLWNQPEMRQKK